MEGLTTRSKLTFLDMVKQNDPADARSHIGPATAFVSHTWGDCFCDTVDALLPRRDACYQAMTMEPSGIGLIDRIFLIIIYCFPFVGWLILPFLGSRERVLDHMTNPRWWTPRAVVDLGEVSVWIDIFLQESTLCE